MTIQLSEVNFEGDFFQTDLPNGDVLMMYALDEVMVADGLTSIVNDIILVRLTPDNVQTKLTTVIGIEENGIAITTKHTELLGEVLSLNNKDNCFIEVAEDE